MSLLKISYYFDSWVGYIFPGFWVVLAGLLLIFFTSFVASFKLSRNKRLSGQRRWLYFNWINLGFVVSLVGLFLLFFRYEGIRYFNWRLWPALLCIGTLAWAGYLLYFQKRILPLKIADQQAQISKSYYFRRRRKKK